MARKFDGPLSEADIAYLRKRYPNAYTDHLIRTLGRTDGEDSENAEETAEQGGPGTPGSPDGESAGDGAEEAEDDDLIGATPAFDPLRHTESEIKAHLAGVSEEEKQAILNVERNRQDREPRKGVLSL